jgi:GNAT superfamily N-acetyltransferase
MAFEAHPLTKERWPDLVELFDRPIVRTCFCMFYRKTETGTGVGPENRKAMKALVNRATVPGLIGYKNGVPVAWVSLGPREDYAKLRRSPVMKPVDDRPVWSIVCFFVDRGARGRGLSERMLRAAVDYARSCGARLVEAYPVDKEERSHPDSMFFGAKSMYDRAGFREVARRRPTRPVMRKALRPRTLPSDREPEQQAVRQDGLPPNGWVIPYRSSRCRVWVGEASASMIRRGGVG